jgi:hypothetical protein
LSDETHGSAEPNEQGPSASPIAFPPLGFPAIYADNVSSLSHGGHVIKYYLSRTDPSLAGQTRAAQYTPVMLVVMPIDGFVRTALFFEKSLNILVSEGHIKQEEINAVRSAARSASEE